MESTCTDTSDGTCDVKVLLEEREILRKRVLRDAQACAELERENRYLNAFNAAC